METIVYFLCAATSTTCAVLLFRSYFATRVRLLLWSALCFTGLSLNNLMLFADDYTPWVDLSGPRNVAALAGLILLLYGLIWETRS